MSPVPIEDQRQKSWEATPRARRVLVVDSVGSEVSFGGSSSYKTFLDDLGTGVSYLGKAAPGTLTSAASWQIQRITESGADVNVEYANGSAAFDNVWDDRASLSYS